MAAELIGGAFLSSLLDVMFERLGSHEFRNLFREKRLITGPLEKLKISLWSASNLLNDAEDKQITNNDVKNWVDLLNEVLQEAEAVVDKINTKALGREIKERRQSQCNVYRILKKVIPTWISAFDMAIKPEIENVLERLKFILDQKDCLGLREGIQSKRLERLPAPLIADPSDVYGRDRDKEAIIQLILSNDVSGDEKITVIPIVGMGGIGQTTLARLVYNDERVKSYFKPHITWVTVSDDFKVLRLAKAVFKGLTSQECDVEELDQLQVKLEAAMSGKNFLLVLDDVWNEDYNSWTVLKSCLQVGANGSKIIVTTCSEIVAKNMGSVLFHPVRSVLSQVSLVVL